ncbi:hypothetical protein [Streptomyces sp. NRRL B-24484]|uniref:hypothetical protein n=1 Tax=Streptomyces sp. NRRL B-24484 TaxID=1463833 RepID=UPI0004C0FD77|nr:hypothetical protein [Streptomyces sp. NRRL B-24484]
MTGNTPARSAAARTAVRRTVRRAARGAAAAAALTGALALACPAPAAAAAYTKAVYAPDRAGNTLTGWGNLSRDCSGTVGCYNYIKIERSRWYGWDFMGGNWANNNGWNTATATVATGCYAYRTTVDSYNDIVGGYGAGVNTGQVGATVDGQKIYRFRVTWSSGTRTYCR